MNIADTFSDLLNKAGSAAIDVYRDKNTAPVADRPQDVRGDFLPQTGMASGISLGMIAMIGGGLLLLLLLVRR